MNETTLHECVTCGQELNVLPGYNCQRCATATSQASTPVVVQELPAPQMTGQIEVNAKIVADSLSNAFYWGATEDPKGYWSDVHARLMRIHLKGR